MPKATIVVPSYNRPDRLADCLDALTAQTVEDIEIVVIDDGSPDPLYATCQPFGSRVNCIRQSNAGPAAARNRGAEVAQSSFLAFTDDDCRPSPDWVQRLLIAHAGDPSRLVGGRVVNGLPENRYSDASQELCNFLYDYFGAARGTMPFFTTNNMGLSRNAFLRLGGFDRSFRRAAAEDRDFGMRWAEEGGQLHYAEDALVTHFHSLTFRRFLRQHANYGAGAATLHRVVRKQNRGQPRFESLGFYLRLITWPITRRRPRRIDLSALMVVSQVAMVHGYISSRLFGDDA